MKWLIVLLRWFLYGWAGLSGLLMVGVLGSSAFIVSFTVENQTNEPLFVTPIGTVGKAGRRHLLPVSIASSIDFPATQSSRFRLAPGKSVSIAYDMDDINFSEIVVENEHGEARQLVADPTPNQRQYHGPVKRSLVIDSWDNLEPLSDAVRSVSLESRPYQLGCLFLALIVPPWILLVLWRLISNSSKQLEQSGAPSP